jgi:outer membrane immunogenic protein
MFKFTIIFGLAALGLASGLARVALGQDNARIGAQNRARLPLLDSSIRYTYVRANAAPGNCGCFGLNGGSADVSLRLVHGLSAVFDVTGAHTSSSNLEGQSLSLLFVTAGPRFSHAFSRSGRASYVPFVQGLAGYVHGFDAAFPSLSADTQSSANRLALLVGGGLNIQLNHGATYGLTLRPIQADYGFTKLPNNSNNSQNLLRISAGIGIHLP